MAATGGNCYVGACDQVLACYTLRAGLEDGRSTGRLDIIAIEGETQEWREWARRQVAVKR